MDPVYLDYAATTPMRPEVRAAMAPCFEGLFGNPSSTHRWGREAAAALAEARSTCAEVLGARFSEIHFVRGGTESDNLAVGGRFARYRADGHAPAVIVSAIEHKAVLDVAKHVTARGGGRLVVLSVDPAGALDLDALDRALATGPSVVSAMWVNNETGMILPVPEVAARTSAAGATLHTDAVQAAGKVPVRVDEVPVDLLTVTGHKIYGPKGTALLFVREGTHLEPALHGGGQERALRPGTEDVAGAVGLATALRLAVAEREHEVPRLRALRDDLERRLRAGIPDMRVNAGTAPRAPHVSSVAVPGVEGTSLLMALDLEGVALSGGSACSSGSSRGSHVIEALYGASDPYATIRFSMGRETTQEGVERAAAVTASVVARLRGRAAS
ncbi:MAG TPA: cysteine desulfurase family protein [Longimicrobiales bacterium]|nr:cysteine desulfurase family protein [Longimicrobiales bacterium]